MEYMFVPKSQKNGECLCGEYNGYAKRYVFPVFLKQAIWLIAKDAEKLKDNCLKINRKNSKKCEN